MVVLLKKNIVYNITTLMNIRLIEQSGNHTTYDIPKFIDSMVLFDSLTDITNV